MPHFKNLNRAHKSYLLHTYSTITMLSSRLKYYIQNFLNQDENCALLFCYVSLEQVD